jgi:hypothetical protein
MKIRNQKEAVVAVAFYYPGSGWYYYMSSPASWDAIEHELPDEVVVSGSVRVARFDPIARTPVQALGITAGDEPIYRVTWGQLVRLVSQHGRPKTPRLVWQRRLIERSN